VEKGKGRPSKKSKLNNEQPKTIDLDISEQNYIDNPDNYTKDKMEKIRENLEVKNGKGVKVLLACAWSTDEELVTWSLFPETVSMDTTFKTNNEKRALFTVTCLDNNRKALHVMSIFVPSEQKWVFHYIFNYVMPKMVGMETINKCEVALTDGDSCEYMPLRNLCENKKSSPWHGTYPAICTYHRINQDWMKKGTSTICYVKIFLHMLRYSKCATS